MVRILKKLTGMIFPVFLVLIAVFISYKSYSFGSFLIGWDSLHPDFNFPLNISRLFWGVWRGEQGVGAIAAHSHMVELIRLIFLWPLSFVLPLELLRSSYIFTCLMLGPIGIYLFVKSIFGEEDGYIVKISSFISGLFYLLNLTTVQHFIVPFEMFCVQYALLPYIFLFTYKYFQRGRKKDLIIFTFITLFASPMAYASSLYWAFLGAYSIYLASYWLFTK